MADPFLGEIRVFAGSFAPRGWAVCDGSLLSLSQNTALFSLLGTTYGGNGQTTFGLPDLRGRCVVGPGAGPGLSPYDQGQQGGSESVTLSVNQMPSHGHMVTAQGGTANDTSPQGKFLAATGKGGTSVYSADQTSPTTMAPTMVQNAGGSQPTPVLSPYTCILFIIALEGIYPSRP